LSSRNAQNRQGSPDHHELLGIDWNGYSLTSGDVSRLLSVDLKTVHNWVKRGHVAGRRTEGRHLRFMRSEIVRFMRRFGYPVPTFLGAARVRAVLTGEASAFRKVHLLRRDFDLTECPCLFSSSLAIADGTYDAVVVDLDEFSRKDIGGFVRALRSCSESRQVCLVGLSQRAQSRAQFVKIGGDVAIDVAKVGDLRGVLRWLVGSVAGCPPGATSCFGPGTK
jgi:excisionase family DNA binding protein